MDIGSTSYRDMNAWTTKMIAFNNTAVPIKGITFQDVLDETNEIEEENPPEPLGSAQESKNISEDDVGSAADQVSNLEENLELSKNKQSESHDPSQHDSEF